MKWRKRGLIYSPNGAIRWAQKYAFPPIPYLTAGGDVIRVYLSFCDENTVGRIGFIDVNAANPSEIIDISKLPVLDVGEPGSFDENGVLPTSIVQVGSELYLYYVGYQLGMKVRYYQFQGLAISKDGGRSFHRRLRVPIIDRSDAELLNRTSAFVARENRVFKMWYVAGSDWIAVRGKLFPRYNMRYIESRDGIEWPKEGEVCLDYANADEHAFVKPFVINEGTFYRMFYSSRTKSRGYRLGYAESKDGRKWIRKDEEIGIDVSVTGWDSEMIEYASVVKYEETVYMFYNGNNCGETGFGYATLEHW
jgi:hypothetical protein